jgi:lysylphosphatidylglycerol synthetase-like protein (DUF2156 family)
MESESRKGVQSEFRPGFRFSPLDAGALVSAGLLAWWAGSRMPIAGFFVLFVVVHFFLFCNVFRISRRSELVWAGTLILLVTVTSFTTFPGWRWTIPMSLLLTIVLVVLEMRKPSYHGIGWRRINPNLQKWWDQSHGSID